MLNKAVNEIDRRSHMLCFLNDYDLLLPDQIHYRIVFIFSHNLKLIFQHFLHNQLLLHAQLLWTYIYGVHVTFTDGNHIFTEFCPLKNIPEFFFLNNK